MVYGGRVYNRTVGARVVVYDSVVPAAIRWVVFFINVGLFWSAWG